MTYFCTILLFMFSNSLFASLPALDMVENPEGPFLEIRNSSYPVTQDKWMFGQVAEIKVSRLRVGEKEFYIPWLLPAAVVEVLAEKVKADNPEVYHAVAKNFKEGGHILLHYIFPDGWQLRGDDMFSDRPPQERTRYDRFMIEVPNFVSAKYIEISPANKTLETFFSLFELKEWIEAYCKDFKLLNPNPPTSSDKNPYSYLCFQKPLSVANQDWDIAERPTIVTPSFLDTATVISFPYVLNFEQAKSMNAVPVRPDHIYYVPGDQVQIEFLLDCGYSQLSDETILPLPIQLSDKGICKGGLLEFLASQKDLKTELQSEFEKDLVLQMTSHQSKVKDVVSAAMQKAAELDEEISPIEGRLTSLLTSLFVIANSACDEKQFQSDLQQLEEIVSGRNLLSKIKAAVKKFWATYINDYLALGILEPDFPKMDEPQVISRDDAAQACRQMKEVAAIIQSKITKDQILELHRLFVRIKEVIAKARQVRIELEAGVVPIRFKKGTSAKERVVMLKKMDFHLDHLKEKFLKVFTELEDLILATQDKYPKLYE